MKMMTVRVPLSTFAKIEQLASDLSELHPIAPVEISPSEVKRMALEKGIAALQAEIDKAKQKP